MMTKKGRQHIGRQVGHIACQVGPSNQKLCVRSWFVLHGTLYDRCMICAMVLCLFVHQTWGLCKVFAKHIIKRLLALSFWPITPNLAQ